MSAVDKLRSKSQSKPFSVHTKDDRKKEADEAKKYDNVKNAWDTYEDIAQDKPDPANSKDSRKGKETFHLKSFSSLRNGYISSIDDLRPESKPFLVQTKQERKKEAEKVKTYNNLKKDWEKYEDIAHDKADPKDLIPKEEAVEERVTDTETAANRNLQEYAEEVVKAFQDNNGSDDDSTGDDKWDFRILEAKREEAEEEKERKKKEKTKRRKEKDAQQKRLEAEGGDIIETAKRLKEEARKKREEEKAGATNSKTKEGDREEKEKNAYKWYKLYAKPTRETLYRIAQYAKGPDFTRKDVDLLPWNVEETEVAEEAMKSPKKKRRRKKTRAITNAPHFKRDNWVIA
jgi:hypothetical protein